MSFFCTKAGFRLAHRTLFAAAVAALVLGSQASSQAALIVSLEQVGGPAVAVSGQQTVVEMLLKVQGDGTPANFNTDTFTTVLSWATSDAVVTDLYNVNAVSSTALTPAFSSAALVSNVTGYLFAIPGTIPGRLLNDSGVDGDFQRALLVDTELGSGFVELNTSATTTIASIFFGVAADVTGTFNFTIDDSAVYGFVNDASPTAQTIGFTNGGGTLQVVPEPSTVYSLFAAGLVTTGLQIRRLRRRKAA